MNHGSDIQDWVDAGFTESQANEWSQSIWGHSLPKLIMSRIRSTGYSVERYGLPSASFKDLGFDLRESMSLLVAGFTDEFTDSPESIEFFRGLGLTMREIIEFRIALEEKWVAQEHLDGGSWTLVRASLEEIHSAGLRLNISNLELYRGLPAEKILSIIDSGVNAKLAIELIDYDFSSNELSLVARLVDLGVSASRASFLVRRKIKVKDISRITSKELSPQLLVTFLEKVPNASIEVALTWLEAGFSAQEAVGWIRAGVSEIDIANRRKTAGIRPQE